MQNPLSYFWVIQLHSPTTEPSDMGIRKTDDWNIYVRLGGLTKVMKLQIK